MLRAFTSIDDKIRRINGLSNSCVGNRDIISNGDKFLIANSKFVNKELINCGKESYLNSIVQCLIPFDDLLKNLLVFCKENNFVVSSFSEYSLLHEYSKFLNYFLSNNVDYNGGFLLREKFIKSILGANLLDGLTSDKEYNPSKFFSSFCKYTDECVAEIELANSGIVSLNDFADRLKLTVKNKALMNAYFQYIYRKDVCCKNDENHVKATISKSFFINVLPDAVSLDKCLFRENELLFCDHCDSTQEHRQDFTVNKANNGLVFLLDRFKVSFLYFNVYF